MGQHGWKVYLLFAGVMMTVSASGKKIDSNEINTRIEGTLVDLTANSGCDLRMDSPALGERRDMYIYLPPNYDPSLSYPMLVWLHGYSTDEKVFAQHVVEILDEEVSQGRCAPLIVAAPDGSLSSRGLFCKGSWYVNSDQGRFADYILHDVVGYMEEHYSVRLDRWGRAIGGFSMGGFGAYNLGMKNRDRFNLIAGISPALNLRYSGCSQRYFEDFDPDCWYYRENYSPFEVVGKFYGGAVKVRAWQMISPVFGNGTKAARNIAPHNPIELLAGLQMQRGQQQFFIGYGKCDEMNVDAMVESFLHVATKRNIQVMTLRYKHGNHSIPFMAKVFPEVLSWLSKSWSVNSAHPTPVRVVQRQP